MAKHKNVLTAYQIEQRFGLIRTFLAAGFAMVFCFFLIVTSSDNPGADIVTFLTAPLSSISRFGTFLIKLSPLLFTSCAICLLFSAGIFNLAVEGAFFVAAVAATSVAVIPGLPMVLHFLLVGLVGAATGAAVLFIPAVLNRRFGANMVVCSLMLNYICTYLSLYLIKSPLRDPGAGYEASYPVQPAAKLFKFFNAGGTEVHSGLLIGVLMVAFTYFLLFKTTFGYKARTIGFNPRFGEFSGISVGKMVVLVSLVAGMITGFGGAVEITGYYSRLNWTASPGYGWDGIMIATLAGNNPKFAILAAMFLAYVRTSADILNITSVVPIEIVDIAQSVVIVMIAARGLLHSIEKRTIVKNSQKQIESHKEEA